jgi:hypothetical protein
VSIDTENKRRSALGLGGYTRVLPVPDDSVGAIDRPHVIGSFARDISAITADATWERANTLKKTERGDELTTAALPPGTWNVYIKAFDTTGNESEESAFTVVTVQNTFDLIYNTEEAPRWTGEKSNCFVHDVSGRLVPTDNTTASGDNFNVFDSFVQDPVATFGYESPEIDVGFDENGLRIWGESLVKLGPGESGGFSKTLQIDYRLTSDSYDGFENWTIGRADARYVKHKILASTDAGTPYLESFAPIVDVEERTQKEKGKVVAVSGTTITFPTRFISAPIVTVTVDGATALYPVKSNVTATGFDVTVYDNSGTDVGGIVDYIAIGV